MPLEMQDRQLGRVAVIKCAGRIVAGTEAQSLESHINKLGDGCRDFLLDIAEVNFIDSSGLGTLVRLVARLRRSGGDLKLCAPPAPVQHLLKITNLLQVFDVHESEVSALSAFYGRSRPLEARTGTPACRLLCIHPSVDTLVYLREVLHRSGYDAITASNVPDAVILLKATAPALVILAEDMQSARSRSAAAMLQEARPDVPVIALEKGFSTQDAGQAGSWLLDAVRSRLGTAATAG
ncbi:MAG TPA: anti-sigma factor antagonist [Terriglobales bacterium]|nr:anti-sigma factor antagonist [Terriglobales bacterium]